MTDDRVHAGETIGDVELDDVLSDADDVESADEADEILEGLLGAGAGAREDVPSKAEADELRADAQSDADSDDTPAERWTCRFCHDTRRGSPATHHDVCSETAKWRSKQRVDHGDEAVEKEAKVRNRRDDLDDQEDDADRGDRETDSRYLISPVWHEFAAYLKYTNDGLSPFYAMHQLMRRTDWSDGVREFTVEYDGLEYTGEFSYQESGLKPWDADEFQIEKVREFRLKLRGPDDIRKASFHLAPRWPAMESKDDYSSPTNPRDYVGVEVGADGSNHEPLDYPKLLSAAADELGVNGGQSKQYFAPFKIAPFSVITDAERYVRINKGESGPLYSLQGPLERMGLLLAGDRDGYRKHVADDRECPGYYHVATFGTSRADRVIPGHRIGKECKHYHMRDPDAQQGATEHPKYGVAFQTSVTDDPVYWNAATLDDDDILSDDVDDLHTLQRELDETLFNTLNWAGLPTRPDHQIYESDKIFEVEGESRELTFRADPLPSLENEQEHMVTRALNRMTDLRQSDTDAKVIDEMLADGGEMSPDDLADNVDVHYRTVLKSLDRLGDVVEHNYGEVQFKSKHIAQQLAERAGALLENFGRWHEHADRLGDELDNAISGHSGGESAFSRWAGRYLDGVDDVDDDARIIMRMGYRPADSREAREILRDGVSALVEAFGPQVARNSRLAKWGEVHYKTAGGQRTIEQPGRLRELMTKHVANSVTT